MRNICKSGLIVLTFIGIVWFSTGCVSLSDYKKTKSDYEKEMAALKAHNDALA